MSPRATGSPSRAASAIAWKIKCFMLDEGGGCACIASNENKIFDVAGGGGGGGRAGDGVHPDGGREVAKPAAPGGRQRWGAVPKTPPPRVFRPRAGGPPLP